MKRGSAAQCNAQLSRRNPFRSDRPPSDTTLVEPPQAKFADGAALDSLENNGDRAAPLVGSLCMDLIGGCYTNARTAARQ